MVRRMSPAEVREHSSPLRVERRAGNRSRDWSFSRTIESVFGDKRIVDHWGNWQRNGSKEDKSEKRTVRRTREPRKSDKKPRSGRRATSWRRKQSSSEESGRKRNYSYRSEDERGRNRRVTEEKVKREKKKLIEKKRYEQDRLEQVRRREDRIIREEERYEKQAKERVDNLKREARRDKKMEEERLKKEQDLYEREKKLQDLKQDERLGSPKRRRSPHLHERQKSSSPKHNRDGLKGSPRPQRSGRSNPVVTVSLSSSPVRRKSLKSADRNFSNGDMSASPPLSPKRSRLRRSSR